MALKSVTIAWGEWIPARNFFTILNTLPSMDMYQTSHLVHMTLFGMVYPWLLGLHLATTLGQQFVAFCINTGIEAEIVRYHTFTGPNSYAKSQHLYGRVDVNDPRLQDDLHEAITAEALTADLLCSGMPQLQLKYSLLSNVLQ